ncbi:MAG: hypothetical protein GWN58_41730, partial [Anaerolineae bacterium]|nr:hypothetical protein [Anaerolineae bacterium]
SLGKRLRRWALEYAMSLYLGGVGLLTLATVLSLVGYALVAGATPEQWIAVALLSLIPATVVAVNLANWLITHVLPSSVLPKMDFSEGIPPDCHTMVVVPSLLTNTQEIEFLLQQLELHYLGNADPHLRFALLTDFADAPEEHMPEDDRLVEQARR